MGGFGGCRASNSKIAGENYEKEQWFYISGGYSFPLEIRDNSYCFLGAIASHFTYMTSTKE